MNREIDELKMFEIFQQNQIQTQSLLKKTPLETDHWEEFKMKDLLDFERGERLVELDKVMGDIPFVTVSFYNNGISSFISLDIFENRKKLFQNRITIDIFGNVFYHSYNYFSNDSIHTFLLKSEEELTIYTNLFLVSILRKLKVKYSFGR